MVERRPEKAGVASSILAPGTIEIRPHVLALELTSSADIGADLSPLISEPIHFPHSPAALEQSC